MVLAAAGVDEVAEGHVQLAQMLVRKHAPPLLLLLQVLQLSTCEFEVRGVEYEHVI